MKYRKLTEKGDYSFGLNKDDYIVGKEAITQAIKTKLLLFYGEWWEDISIGIPIFQSILGQVKDQNVKIAIDNLVSQRILEIPEVTRIVEIKTEFDRRNVTMSIKCLVNEELEIETEVIL